MGSNASKVQFQFCGCQSRGSASRAEQSGRPGPGFYLKPRVPRPRWPVAEETVQAVTLPVTPTRRISGMDEPFISSDPNAWLRPFWADLQRQPFFGHLAPELQAGALASALEADYPAKAQEIREWNLATRRAMLALLDQALIEDHTARETELWRMRKGEREVRCVAVYTAVGVDLRLLEAEEMLRTELCKSAPTSRAKAARWHSLLTGVGWTLVASGVDFVSPSTA